MKALRFKETGEIGQFHDIDAVELLRAGEYEAVETAQPAEVQPLPDRVSQLEQELTEARATIANLEGVIASQQAPTKLGPVVNGTIAGPVQFAPPTPVDPAKVDISAIDAVKSNIAAIEAKKSVGTATTADHMQLGKLVKKLEKLTA